MHLAKGLEFGTVVVMACDDEVIPLDAADLREVYETERHLLYVACTRARDHLLVTAVAAVFVSFRHPSRRDVRAGTLRGRGGASSPPGIEHPPPGTRPRSRDPLFLRAHHEKCHVLTMTNATLRP
jgi:hypothetical protein